MIKAVLLEVRALLGLVKFMSKLVVKVNKVSFGVRSERKFVRM